MAALSNTAAIEFRRLANGILDSFEKYGRDEQYDHVIYPILETMRRFNLQAHWVGIRAGLCGWQLRMHDKEPLKSENPKQELRSVAKLMTRMEDTRKAMTGQDGCTWCIARTRATTWATQRRS
jgi:hypothetical protein